MSSGPGSARNLVVPRRMTRKGHAIPGDRRRRSESFRGPEAGSGASHGTPKDRERREPKKVGTGEHSGAGRFKEQGGASRTDLKGRKGESLGSRRQGKRKHAVSGGPKDVDKQGGSRRPATEAQVQSVEVRSELERPRKSAVFRKRSSDTSTGERRLTPPLFFYARQASFCDLIPFHTTIGPSC